MKFDTYIRLFIVGIDLSDNARPFIISQKLGNCLMPIKELEPDANLRTLLHEISSANLVINPDWLNFKLIDITIDGERLYINYATLCPLDTIPLDSYWYDVESITDKNTKQLVYNIVAGMTNG